jgi:hypothetical protein
VFDDAQPLCCHPLEVGLAREARSTEARWRGPENKAADLERAMLKYHIYSVAFVNKSQ